MFRVSVRDLPLSFSGTRDNGQRENGDLFVQTNKGLTKKKVKKKERTHLDVLSSRCIALFAFLKHNAAMPTMRFMLGSSSFGLKRLATDLTAIKKEI